MTDDDRDRRLLGERLRELRTERELSLAEVAERTGISTSFLSHVENGKGDISFTRVRRIVETYGLGMMDLFPVQHEDPDIVRAHEVSRQISPPGLEIFLLAPDARRVMEPLLVEWEPGAEADYDAVVGEEFIHVLQGALRIDFETGESMTVCKGDNVYFKRLTARRYTNVSKGKTRNISILSPPL